MKKWISDIFLATNKKKWLNRRVHLENNIPRRELEKYRVERQTLNRIACECLHGKELQQLIAALNPSGEIAKINNSKVLRMYNRYEALIRGGGEGRRDLSDEYRAYVIEALKTISSVFHIRLHIAPFAYWEKKASIKQLKLYLPAILLTFICAKIFASYLFSADSSSV